MGVGTVAESTYAKPHTQSTKVGCCFGALNLVVSNSRYLCCGTNLSISNRYTKLMPQNMELRRQTTSNMSKPQHLTPERHDLGLCSPTTPGEVAKLASFFVTVFNRTEHQASIKMPFINSIQI